MTHISRLFYFVYLPCSLGYRLCTCHPRTYNKQGKSLPMLSHPFSFSLLFSNRNFLLISKDFRRICTLIRKHRGLNENPSPSLLLSHRKENQWAPAPLSSSLPLYFSEIRNCVTLAKQASISKSVKW